MKIEHPIQPLVKDKHGVVRFKQNAIIVYLLDLCTAKGIADMNTLAVMQFTKNDREQFAQLIGYSLRGFGELSYVRNKTYAAAAVKVEEKLG